MSGKKYAIGGAVVVVIFGVGFFAALKIAEDNGLNGKTLKNVSVVTDASHATFTYMTPADTTDWQPTNHRPVFDKTEGVVSYILHSKPNNTDVTISQQPMPSQLTTKSGLNRFIASSNVVASQQAGAGTVYFRAEQTVGGASSGAVTVIYATKKILMFGAAGQPLSYATWSKLMASMKLN